MVKDTGLTAKTRKWFRKYEKEGFDEAFHSPYHDKSGYEGKLFKVISRCRTDGLAGESWDDECLPAWNIRFEDGATIQAFPEEICRLETAK